MSYVSLYRRFRPDTFDKVIGQDHIVRTITNQISTDRIGHAYLFTGTRGTGKTSCAKIFAKAVNCLNPVNGSPCGECEICKALAYNASTDIIEIDAASNNGVDEIRELRENAQYRPTVARYKVYIIDEVHMLSTSAFNALLKTLEEPPQHVIFILATTEVQKLPQTILSRCMRFDFRLVSVDNLVNLLKRIFDELSVKYEDKALFEMAIHGEGSVRDTLSIADMCMSYCGEIITEKDTLDILCATDFDSLHDLGKAILESDIAKALELINFLMTAGRNTVAKDLANYFMDMLELKNAPDARIDRINEAERSKLMSVAEKHTNYKIARIMDIMASLEANMRYSTQPRILLEANIVKACELVTETNLDGLTNRVRELEKKLAEIKANGIVSAPLPTVSKTVIDIPQPVPVVEHKNDISKLIEELQLKPDEKSELIFDTELEKSESNNYLASEVMSKIITKLSEANEATLTIGLSQLKPEDLSINNNIFLIETTDKATFNLIRSEDNFNLIEKIIKEELGDDYTFDCQLPATDTKSLSEDDRISLKELFSGKIKFRK